MDRTMDRTIVERQKRIEAANTLPDEIVLELANFLDYLWREKQRIFMQELADAYKEQASDPEFKEDVSIWDVTVDDGLDA